MLKTLIATIFLSQAPIQTVRVFHGYDTSVVTVPVRYISSGHIRVAAGMFPDTPETKWNPWYSKKPPVPYWFYWTCNFPGQTAQQCVAIHSLLEQELRQ